MTWITGKQILERPRWGLKAELIKAFKAGLRPYREADEAMLTARIERDGNVVDPGSRCFYCVHGSVDRGYMAPGCPRNDFGQNIDIIIEKIIKPGVEKYRGRVDKTLFRDGLPCNVFDFLGYSADAEFLQSVEDQVGSDNLRAMLIESHCRHQELVDTNEIGNRLLAAKFRLRDVKAYERRSGIEQDGEDQEENASPPEEWPTAPLDFAKALLAIDKYRINPAERIRLIKERYPYLKSAQIAAYARGYPPDANNEEACKKWYQRNKPK